MAGRFFGKTSTGSTVQDFANIFASTVGTQAQWSKKTKPTPTSVYTYGDFISDDESYNQAGGSDTTNVTVPSFVDYNGDPISGVKIGYLPTKNYLIKNLSSAGSYTFIRTDAALTFYKNGTAITTVPKAQFRDGVVPYQIIVIASGGGGGGGGNGSYCNGKDDFTQKCGGAGGGGATVGIRLTLQTNTTYYVTIGDYGKAGSSNTTTEGKSSTTGTAGSTGGATSLSNGSVNLLYCNGGGGGGAGGASGHGAGGAGGTGSVYTSTITKYVTRTGGKGNCASNTSQSGVSSATFTPTTDTGVGAVSACTTKNNNASTANSTTAGKEYFSGGCSYGYGRYFQSSATSSNIGGSGGGGTASTTQGPYWGNTGGMLFYY